MLQAGKRAGSKQSSSLLAVLLTASLQLLLSSSFLCSCTGVEPQSPSAKVPESFGKPIESESLPLKNIDSKESEPEQSEIIRAQNEHARKVEVQFSAYVKKLLRDDTKGLPHQRFLLELENGTTVKVAHDTKYAPRVPLQPGDLVKVKGEYIWNEKGGVLHWTHRSDNPRHEGGYIELSGTRYE